MLGDLQQRGETIEECYEFMLAYAAQGLPSDVGSRTGGQVREYLTRAAKALEGLGQSFAASIEREGLEPAAKYRAFLTVLERDAQNSLAAVELVLAQPVISSQLIDNLNASIHLRALLTDMFLLGEIIAKQNSAAQPQTA
jgi:hypothetical protein